MSILYTFEAFLKAECSQENIGKIIYRGKDLRFVYIDDFGTVIINDLKVVIEKIFYIIAHREVINYSHIEVQYQDTYLFFFFYKTDDGLLQINMGPAASMWKEIINGEEGYYIDKDRYIGLMIDLLKDFEILRFNFYADNEIEIIIP